MSTVTVRLWAGIAEAAGRRHGDELSDRVESLHSLLSAMTSEHDAPFARALSVCSVLVDGQLTRPSSAPLRAGATVDLMPPYAGG